MSFIVRPHNMHSRHPELVSGSIVPHTLSAQVEGWMLKQVQHDEYFLVGYESQVRLVLRRAGR